MQRLRTVTSLDVSAVAGHHAMPAALLFYLAVLSSVFSPSICSLFLLFVHSLFSQFANFTANVCIKPYKIDYISVITYVDFSIISS